MTKSPPEALQSVHEGPLVSVVIATYNRAHAVGRAIRSALAQTFDDFEIIVVDDGSADDTAEVVQRIEDPRIRFLRHEGNLGPSAARNTGIRASRGTYVALLDSDDEWLPEKLDRQVKALLGAPPDVCLVYCGYERMWKGIVETRLPSAKGAVYQKLLRGNVILGGCSCAVVKKVCLEDAGMFDVALRHAEDHELWLRLARKYRVDFVPAVLARISLGEDNRVTDDLAATEKAIATLDSRYGTELPRTERRHIQAARLLNLGIRWLRCDETRRARRILLRCVSLRPLHVWAWLYLVSTFLPGAVLRLLRRAWRRTRGSEGVVG